VGLDAAAAMLHRAREVSPDSVFVRADLEALPFAPHRLGGAWSRNGHVHVPSVRLPWALAQLQRAMVLGSPLFLSLVPGERDGALADGEDDLPGRFFARWSEPRLRDVVLGAGFEIESVDVPPDGRPIAVRATRSRTLADVVGPAMRMLVCGLNPSLVAADAGYGFAGATNRFWRAAVAAGLVSRPRDLRHALLERGIGMTDLVKRATPKSAAVRRDEYVVGLDRVERLVEWLRPGVVCMVGLEGWRAAADRRATAGWQDRRLGMRPVYVMPSTSGLNAKTSMDQLVAHLRTALGGPEDQRLRD
jgi:TDG/mug DNA glycosylase family protein